MNRKKQAPAELVAQLVLSFALPLIVLTRFSSEDLLGPTNGLLVALVFPILFEIYNIIKNKKVSAVSLVSVGGILVTGGLSLLNLSTGWLAIRRAAPYILMALGIFIATKLKYSPSEKVAEQILDITKLKKHGVTKKTFENIYKTANYSAVGLFAMISVISYFLTRLIVKSPINTEPFNQQYASLRIWSIAAITVPLMAGMVGIIFFVISKLEKITGLEADAMFKK